MKHIGPPRGPLTLHACLEELARLEESFILAGAGDEWTARELLYWLRTFHPQFLQLRVVLVFPEAECEGAIYEVSQKGDTLTDVPLYRLLHQQAFLSTPEVTVEQDEHSPYSPGDS
ncbi:MAG TPA: hypothetical protein VH540_13045 [Ktedonobacterales bacterium]|jgi:hypothetical protein